MEENNNFENKTMLIKKAIVRLSLIIIPTLILIFLINYKSFVNNEITNIYYYVSIVGSIISIIIFGLMFLKQISENLKNKLYAFLDIFYIFTTACCLFQCIFAFGYFKANVDGTSMEPTLENNQVLIVRSSNKNVNNFDVVVAAYDQSINIYNDNGGLKSGDLLVKRVIAKGGDTFYYEDGKLYLNGELVEEEYTNSFTYDFSLDNQRFATQRGALRYDEENDLFYVNEGYYFLMGDNRGVSNDSRQLGLFKEEQIVGVVKYELHGIFDWEKMR